MPSLLEVEGLHVRYGGAEAVRGVDVSVSSGEVSVVLGANGAGKTSTLKAVCGQIRQSAGRIRWDGRDISSWPAYKVARAGLVMVPEGRRVFGPLSVEENLQIGGYANPSRSAREAAMKEVCTMFPILGERRTQPAGLLSGGEQQMLAFGRAMMASPKVILMDEPSMGLAPAVVDRIMDSIAAIAATGIGILMVEQNAMAALEVANRAVVIERGEVLLRGSATEMKSHPDVVKAFLGEKAASQVTGV